MKKAIALFLTLTLALSLFTACGKEPAPAETQEAPAATTLPIVEEVTEPVETTVETVPPAPSTPDYLKIDIDGDLYSLPIELDHLIVNNWSVDCDERDFVEDEEISATFSRNGVNFYGRLRGRSGGSIFDDDVTVSHMEFQLNEDSAFAIHYDRFYAGMNMDDIIPTMESLGFIYIDTYDMGDGDAVIQGYFEEGNYSLSFVVEAGAVIGLVIDS